MLASDQGDHVTEPGAMQVDQALAVDILFGGHAVEHLGRGGVFAAEAFGIAAVDAGIVFLGRDREGEDFLFGEITEPAP